MNEINQRITTLQELSNLLEAKSNDLAIFKHLRDLKMERLKDKEEFLKGQEKVIIQRFRELFDNANNNILNSNEIIIK